MDPILYQTCIQKIEKLEGKLDALDEKSLNTICKIDERKQQKKINELYNKIINIDTHLFNKKITRLFKPLTRDMFATLYVTIWLAFYISIGMRCRFIP